MSESPSLSKLDRNLAWCWLRNNASTIVSQLIDTVVFMLIAFWGVSERFTLGFVLGSMLPPYYLLKVLAAFLDTPLVYLGVNILRKMQHRDAGTNVTSSTSPTPGPSAGVPAPAPSQSS